MNTSFTTQSGNMINASSGAPGESSCLLFIAGGDEVGQTLYSAELVDLCNDGQSTCLEPSSLPFPNENGVSLRTPSGNPLFCGGENDPGHCFQYELQSNTWINGPDMIGQRCSSATVEIRPGVFWILSGKASIDQDTSEYYINGGFVSGPNLPTEGYNKCQT